MSYTSYRYIPYLDTYIEALKRFEATAPIRGSNPVRYPLGRRGDSNKFAIHKTESGDIALSLYGHIGVVFHADNQTLTIGDPTGKRTWRWSSCDSYFVLAVLGRYIREVRTDRGRLVIETRDGQKLVLESKGALTLAHDKANHTLTPIYSADTVLYTHRLNRLATNNVRARYGEFYRYMKGMIGVRKELRVDQYYDYRSQETVVDEHYSIYFSEEEQSGVVPTKEVENRWGKDVVLDDTHPMNKRSPMDKPSKLTIGYEQNPDDPEGNYKQVESPKLYEIWVASTEAFLSLIATPSTDPDQHEKFRQAFVWLGRFASGRNYMVDNIRIEVSALQKTIDEIIFKWHSEEVIERVPAKPNTVPNGKYLKWITRERD